MAGIPTTSTIRPHYDRRYAPAGARMFVVTEQLFKVETLFIVGCDYAAMAKYLNRRYKTQVAEDAIADRRGGKILGTLLTFGIPPWRVVYLRNYEIPIMVHELLHLVTRVLQDRGIGVVSHYPNDDLGDETAAYMLEFYTVAVIQALGYGARPKPWGED